MFRAIEFTFPVTSKMAVRPYSHSWRCRLNRDMSLILNRFLVPGTLLLHHLQN
jgi:hypothetical protein